MATNFASSNLKRTPICYLVARRLCNVTLWIYEVKSTSYTLESGHEFNFFCHFQMRNLSAKVHPTVPPSAAHPDPHGRQTVQVPSSRMYQSLFAAVQPPIPLQVSSDGQTLQVQLLLQVLYWRDRPVGSYSEAQGVQAPQDPHLWVLWQELHPGDLSSQTHAETLGSWDTPKTEGTLVVRATAFNPRVTTRPAAGHRMETTLLQEVLEVKLHCQLP